MKKLLASLVIVSLVAAVGLAEEKKEEKKKRAPNPTGTWTWSREFNGQTMEFTLTLKLGDEGKLTGELARGERKTEISNGTFKDGKIAFTVATERNGQKMTQKYTGTLERGLIKGKVEVKRGDEEPQSRDWEAKRVRAKKDGKKEEKKTT